MEDSREITKEDAEKFKDEYGLDLFMEVSVKTRYNIPEMCVEAAKLLYNDCEKIIRDNDKDYEKLNKKKEIGEEKTQSGNKCLFI